MTRNINKVARREARGASEKLALRFASHRFSQLAPRASRPAPRRGISLLEVLIAMFVLLFGLMGVAAIMPVGNHYAAKGDQYDRGSALAGSAIAEVKARALLRPVYWLNSNNTAVINGTTGFFQDTSADGPGHAFVVDPMGAAEAADARFFPYDANYQNSNANPWFTPPSGPALAGNKWPVRRVTLPEPDRANPGKFIPMTTRVAESIFRLHDDVTGELPEANDQPGIQRWQTVDLKNTPKIKYDDTPLARAYGGSYSWLATVVPVNSSALIGMQPSDPRYGSYLYEVSVAVFYKRDTIPTVTSERQIVAELAPGGDLLIYSSQSNAADAKAEVDEVSKEIRPGQWIALAGVHPVTGNFLLRWYRLLSFEDETEQTQMLSATTLVSGRHAMVEGPDWPTTVDASGYDTQMAPNLPAILLPGVIGVATQTVKLDTE